MGTRRGHYSRLLGLTCLGGSVLVVAIIASCKDDSEQVACTVDTECPTGTICREGFCGSPTRDGGPTSETSVPDTAPSCASDNAACISNSDCCSNICAPTSNICTNTPPTPVCKGQLELCQNDCCPGLTCTNGACK